MVLISISPAGPTTSGSAKQCVHKDFHLHSPNARVKNAPLVGRAAQGSRPWFEGGETKRFFLEKESKTSVL
jgi:hypothetical protein